MNPLIIAGAALVGGVAYAGYKANLVEDMVLFSRSMVPNRRGLTAEQLEAGIRDSATRAQMVSYIGSELQALLDQNPGVALTPPGAAAQKAAQSMMRGSIPGIVSGSVDFGEGRPPIPFYQIRARWAEIVAAEYSWRELEQYARQPARRSAEEPRQRYNEGLLLDVTFRP